MCPCTDCTPTDEAEAVAYPLGVLNTLHIRLWQLDAAQEKIDQERRTSTASRTADERITTPGVDRTGIRER
jgi:hypothetical protein